VKVEIYLSGLFMSDGIEQMQMQAPPIQENGLDKIMHEVRQGFDDFVNGLIHHAANIAGSGVVASVMKTAGGIAAVTGATMTAGTAPFKELIPSASPGQEVSPDRTPGVSIKVAMGSPGFGELGNLSPDATPSQGRSQGASVGRT
jgi:hypothetical protein